MLHTIVNVVLSLFLLALFITGSYCTVHVLSWELRSVMIRRKMRRAFRRRVKTDLARSLAESAAPPRSVQLTINLVAVTIHRPCPQDAIKQIS